MFNTQETNRAISNYLVTMFAKVGIGILITFGISFGLVLFAPQVAVIFFHNVFAILLLIITETALVFIIRKKVANLSLSNVNLLYNLFCGVNGLILTYIYFVFSVQEILTAVLSAAFFFISMAIYGFVTRSDLSKWRSILSSAFLAILLVSVLHGIMSYIFGYRSSFVSLFISCIMVVITSISTAYEMNMYKQFFIKNNNSFKTSSEKENIQKGFITLGALSLYTNYINLVVNILRILYLTRDNKKR